MKILAEKVYIAIANLIMDTLTKVELNLENLRVQEYDGAGNISGKEKRM